MWYSTKRDNQSHKIVDESDLQSNFSNKKGTNSNYDLVRVANYKKFIKAHKNIMTKKTFKYFALLIFFLITAGVTANQLYLPGIFNLIESSKIEEKNKDKTPSNIQIAKNDEITFESSSEAEYSRSLVLLILEDWRKRWIAKDLDGFLSFYHPDFPEKKIFKNNKKRIFKRAKFIKINLKNISSRVENDEIITTFDQSYKSRNFSDTSKKQLRWRRTDFGWKIIEEKIISPYASKRGKK